MRSTRPPERLPLFRSEEQARLLTVLFLGPSNGLTLQELQNGAGVSRATTDREVAALVGAGLVKVDTVGRTRVFSASEDSPLHAPLHALLERTFGVEIRLGDGLEAVPGIEAAAIYGSWAGGGVGPSSDIDVLVVGDVDHGRIAEVAMSVSEAVGREINVMTLTGPEMEARIEAGDRFLTAVLGGKVLNLIGNLGGALNAGPR
ncbi:MAG TPA: nucleotidyltransferase domain-containing protein [Candidatus Dormibacteraeota bacterium]|jgi:predicted nucleotidyltransferase|nr:nucleotidyltransferase domain-containing protein [Candidatus Dormibacteraeota bacterium]